MFEREELLIQLKNTQTWDAIVIGGGASGLGIALDFTTRGFKTLLLEQEDFAKGTSSRSTKLVHGGVRYLAQGNIPLVYEALYERGLLLKNAPHLVHKQSLIVPNYNWFDNFFYTIGLKIYDLLSGRLSFGKSTRINRKETIAILPTLKKDKLFGGVMYYDGQFDDARLAVNLAQSCVENGATVLNHFKVTKLVKDNTGSVSGVVAVDNETKIDYVLNAKVVINATGVFADDILKMDNPKAEDIIRPSQGIHLVFENRFLPGNNAIMIPKTDDGRVLFIIPWHEKILVGTTDTMIEKHSLEPKPLEQEIDFIIQTANNYLTQPVSRKDVLSVFSGLRPLAAPKDNAEKTKEISRSHKIIVSTSGLISIIGGKWTTYRKMAEDTVDKAIEVKKLKKIPCVTKDFLIHGACKIHDNENHLNIYGTDRNNIEQLIQENKELGEILHKKYSYTRAEVVFAIRNEMARTIEDILARRIRLLFLDAKIAVEIAPVVGEILCNELNKSEQWKNDQISDFIKIAKQYILG